MQEVMGPLPGTEKRVSLDVHLREEVDCGSYVRRLIDYASEPGGRVPAYLLIPKGQGPFPARTTNSSSAGTAPMPASWPNAFGAVSSRLGGAGARESDLGQRARC